MTSPWTGTWEWLSDNYDGRTAFTESHFCYASAPKNRNIPAGEEVTDAEAADLAKSFGVAAAGSITARQEGDEWFIEAVHKINLEPSRVGVHEHNVVWVKGDRTFNQGVKPDGTRGPVPPLQYRILSQLGTTPLAGTWELMSDEWNGIMIMTDHHYRYVMTHNKREQFSNKRRELNTIEAAALYRSFDAQCGKYSVSGSTMLCQPVVVKNPKDRGQEIRANYALDNHQLTIQSGKQTHIWRMLQAS